MRILTRYVLAELLQVFFVTLAALTFFILTFGLVQTATKEGLGLVQIALLVPYVLPDALRFAVPATMLFAAASVFGRMSSGNEITALKAAGVSPLQAIWPAITVALVVSFVSVWLNDVAVSWGRDGVKRVIIESVEQILYGRLRTEGSYSSPKLEIVVKAVDGRKLVKPVLTLNKDHPGRLTTVKAREAEIRADTTQNAIIVTFRDYDVLLPGGATYSERGERSQEVPLDAVSAKAAEQRRPAELAMNDFAAARTAQLARIDQFEQMMAGRAALGMLSGRMDQTAPAAVAGERHEIAYARERLRAIAVEPWRRWAGGFSCLCFVLVGAPMAIRMRNADFLTSFFLCFLPILVVYYPLFILGIDQAKDGNVPPAAVWLGNVLVALWGCWLLRRVIRT
jgi:lipopolysaccharide export system permease protein